MLNNYSNRWYNQHTKSHNLKPVLDYLNKHLPISDWFIAGGSVATPTHFNDIDIFFTTPEAFRAADLYFRSLNRERHTSKNAITYSDVPISSSLLISVHYTFQLICKQFDIIERTLEGFDISCSKLAMDPSGEIWAHSDYSDLIRIHNLNTRTFSRISKYIYNKNFKLDSRAFTRTLANLHTNRNQILVDYYDGRETTYLIKKCILTGFIEPFLLDPCVDYVDTLPARSRKLIYSHLFRYPESWTENSINDFSNPTQRSMEFQRYYSQAIQRIPAMIDLFPEDYL